MLSDGTLEWRLNHVTSEEEREIYAPLFLQLDEINFVYVLEKDRNRVADGSELRIKAINNVYLMASRYIIEAINNVYDQNNCSVLDLLISLAVRLDNEIIGDPRDPDPGKIFMEMLSNLKLLDLSLKNPYPRKEIDQKIKKWMSRSFDASGVGSPFPLKNPKKDQREAEIWSQANAYIMENYY